MHQFLGNIPAKADTKGRLFVPAAYRKSLEKAEEGALYLELDAISKCVKLYPESVWKQRDKEIRAKFNLWDKKDVQLYRQFTSRFDQIELDATGRVLIQKRYLDIIEVESEALFVGVGDYFEIWNKNNFDKVLYDEYDYEKAIQDRMGNSSVTI